MDSDNSESGKEEEDDDDDASKAHLNQMLDQQKKYLQLCQTSAKILQVLAGLGAPESTHVIELESVSEDSDVSSCSSPESMSQSPNTEDTSRSESERSAECVIYAEPLLTCQIVTPAKQPCRDVRRLPPGVTPEDVKRSKAEAARMRAAAAASVEAEDEKGQFKDGESSKKHESSTSGKEAKNSGPIDASYSKPRLGDANVGADAYFTLTKSESSISRVDTGSTKCTETGTQITRIPSVSAISSSLAATREDFKRAMSQISNASETIRQAHSLLTSMGLGHYSLRRRLAQVNNNNNPDTADETNGTVDTHHGTLSTAEQTSSMSTQTSNGLEKRSKTEADNEGAACKEPVCDGIEKTADAISTFPPLLMVKPISEKESKRNGCLKDATEYKTSDSYPRPIKDENPKERSDPNPKIFQSTFSDTHKPSTSICGSSLTKAKDFCIARTPGNTNVSANVRQYRDVCLNTNRWTKWSSHLQPQSRQALNQASGVTRFTNRFTGHSRFSRNTPLLSRTEELTNLATSVQSSTTMCPVNETKENKATCSNQIAETFSLSTGNAHDGVHQEHRQENYDIKETKRQQKTKRQKNLKHKITLNQVKEAVDFAKESLEKSGKWTESWHDGMNPETELDLNVNLNEEINSETKAGDWSTVCIEVVVENGDESEKNFTKVESAAKRVTFLQEPVVISSDVKQFSETTSENTNCHSENEVKKALSSETSTYIFKHLKVNSNSEDSGGQGDTRENTAAHNKKTYFDRLKEISNNQPLTKITTCNPNEIKESTNILPFKLCDESEQAFDEKNNVQEGNGYTETNEQPFDVETQSTCKELETVPYKSETLKENIPKGKRDTDVHGYNEICSNPITADIELNTLCRGSEKPTEDISTVTNRPSVEGYSNEGIQHGKLLRLNIATDIEHERTPNSFDPNADTELYDCGSGSILQTESSAAAHATLNSSSSTVDHVYALMEDDEVLEATKQRHETKINQPKGYFEDREGSDICSKTGTLISPQLSVPVKEKAHAASYTDTDQSVTLSKDEPLYKPSFYVTPSNSSEGNAPTLSSSIDEVGATYTCEPSQHLYRSLSAGDIDQQKATVPIHRTNVRSASAFSAPIKSYLASDTCSKKQRVIKSNKYLRLKASHQRPSSGGAEAANGSLYRIRSNLYKNKTTYLPLNCDKDHHKLVMSAGNSPRYSSRSVASKWGKTTKTVKTEEVSPALSTSVSVIEMMDENKPEQLTFPEPSLTKDPFGIRQGANIKSSDEAKHEIQVKVKIGNTSRASDDDSSEENWEDFKKYAGSSLFSRPWRLRFRHRRRRRRHRSNAWWARSVRCLKSKFRSWFGRCLK
ncbi:hypothetical protein ElyMa_003458400 [Elysia marginata]|uniref:Uncharacterized protein n=1 Tax=Elysia marginata TaxID=1093978 RepID=A0AAV4E9X4_9GAST|nr:hypothetical protein ElyMa_003458400 [Elysia marginata]